MIRRLVDFALQNRLLVLAIGILLFCVRGIISFHRLPVEAYPDVANNYVDVIAQWPGISAEQIEQQVTIPLETVMNGIPGVAHVRSWSIFGLSTVEMVFGEDTTDFENRERVLERLSQVSLPPGVVPQMGTDWSPVGQIYFYTLESSNPEYDVMNLKTIETWTVEKNLKSVPGVVDVNPFGGPTRELPRLALAFITGRQGAPASASIPNKLIRLWLEHRISQAFEQQVSVSRQ